MTIPDAVIIQFVLLKMGMLMLETCRGLSHRYRIKELCIKLVIEINLYYNARSKKKHQNVTYTVWEERRFFFTVKPVGTSSNHLGFEGLMLKWITEECEVADWIRVFRLGSSGRRC